MAVDVGKAIAYLDLDTTKFKQGFKDAQSDMNKFNSSTASTNDKLGALSSSMGKVGSTLTKSVTVPIVAMGTGFAVTAAKFESSMSEVQAISGATGEDLEALTKKAKEMGATTKFSASQSAEALKYMAMAGWDTEKMLAGLPGVMDLAAASGEDLATVSDIVTDAMTAFGLSADQAGHFSDVLAKASSNANTNVSLMGETFKYVAPVAGAMGYSIEDMSLAIGLMANAGIKGSQAGTALRSTISRLAKPTKQSAQAMEDLGISLANSDGSMKDFNTLMLELRESMQGLTADEQARYAALLGGQEAMSGLLAIVNASEEDFNKLSNAVNNADGAAKEMADTMQDNLSGQITILKSSIEGIAIAFGDLMLPAIKSVISGIQDVTTWINSLSEGQKQVVLVIATVLAAIGPLLLIGAKLITVVTTISSAFSAAGISLAAITGPIGIVIAAVAALALAWTTDFGGIREYTAEIFGYIADIFKTFLSWLKIIWNEDLGGIATITKEVLGVIETVVRTVLKVIAGIFQVFSSVLKGDWQGAWDGIKNIVHAALDGIVSGIKGFFSIFKTLASDLIGMFSKGLAEAWEKVMSWFEEKLEWIKDAIAGVFEDTEQAETKASNKKSKKSKGSHRFGLDYVPYDGYTATLHEGERVLTKEENRTYKNNRNQAGSSGDTFVFYNTKPSPAEYAQQMKRAKRELLFDY